MPLSVGQILNNRYRIVRLLGQGGFGAVYRAWDTSLERPCALKENLDASEEAHRQFKREAVILANLSHPNLPHVIDHFSFPGQGQYLVMEFVEGEDLGEIMQRAGGPLQEGQALAWIGQVCDALAYLHSQNPPIIHRDVKPANVKITPLRKGGSAAGLDVLKLPAEETRPYLVDFGIAKVYGGKTTVGARAVTPGYSPHEQYGQGVTDARSDVYALGATLYHLLTGKEPLESIQRMLRDPLLPPERLNPSLTASVAAAIRRALQMDPERRYQTAAEFKAALAPATLSRRASEGTRVRVSPPTTPISQRWRPAAPTASRALPWGWLGAVSALGLAVVILIVVVIGFGIGGGKKSPIAAYPTEAMVAEITDTFAPPRPSAPSPTLPSSPAPTLPSSPSSPLPITEAPSTPTIQGIDFTDEYGVKMKLIPAGEFQMGSESGDSNEKPVHTVYLDAFYMDVYETTNALYARCVEAGACTVPSNRGSLTRDSYYGNLAYGDYPVIYVSWEQSRDFCQWRGARLPSEAEWEKAARGELEGKLYPWGDDSPVCEKGAFNGVKFDDDAGCNDTDTEPVGSYSANGYGLFDMAGNVWEWVWDWYSENYYASSPSENPIGPSSGGFRCLRGGSWLNSGNLLRVAVRGWDDPPGSNGHSLGIRCARSR